MDGKKEERGQADKTKAPIRRSHTSRELRMLDIIDRPPSKRVRRPTRGAEAVDNSCEATRESNMICPITCGCQNSLLDIMAKTRVVSLILRASGKILENELIACFGLTAAMTNKDERNLRTETSTTRKELRPRPNQYTIYGTWKHPR